VGASLTEWGLVWIDGAEDIVIERLVLAGPGGRKVGSRASRRGTRARSCCGPARLPGSEGRPSASPPAPKAPCVIATRRAPPMASYCFALQRRPALARSLGAPTALWVAADPCAMRRVHLWREIYDPHAKTFLTVLGDHGADIPVRLRKIANLWGDSRIRALLASLQKHEFRAGQTEALWRFRFPQPKRAIAESW
jgi:hypothetical protein